MIQTFKNQATQNIFNGEVTKQALKICPRNIWKIASRKLDQLDSVSLNLMNFGYHQVISSKLFNEIVRGNTVSVLMTNIAFVLNGLKVGHQMLKLQIVIE